MKKRIVLTGGGTGGHFFPLLAVALEIKRISGDAVDLCYLGPKSPLNEEFSKHGIRIYWVAGGKLRRYFDFRNFLDIPKFFFGFFQALFRLYFLMPDIVFSKGGTGALPVVLAARFYFIPVVIHESDSVPGLVNRISSRFAEKIFISFEQARAYFQKNKTVLTGNPIRAELLINRPEQSAAKARLKFKKEEPLAVFLGGSQGAVRLNNFVFDNLESLLGLIQVFHQVGGDNVSEAAKISAQNERYRFAGFLNTEEMKFALSAADIIVSRAGAGAIFEIASFAKPSILIPLKESANNHQQANAYEYGQGGATIIIDEPNFIFSVIHGQIENLLKNREIYETMSRAARNFAKPEAAEQIAKNIIEFIKN